MYGNFLRNLKVIATYVYCASKSIFFLTEMKKNDWIYRQAHAVNSTHHISHFGINTSTSNLRKHLFADHIGDWVDSCQKLNIPITAVAALEAIRQYRKEPVATPLESERPQYSKEAFIDAMIDFVVGDDLVCFSFHFFN